MVGNDEVGSVVGIDALREQHYNATVTHVNALHSGLMILRVRPDAGALQFDAGQYTTLGLGYWEPRLPEAQQEQLHAESMTRIVNRAYSISCRMLNEAGQLARVSDGEELEFYIALVLQAEKPPALTPRLFMLRPGDRLHLARRCHGNYVLGDVAPDETVVFMATGTGEAPHNAIVADLLATQRRGPIVSVVCVRHRQDLGYLAEHRALERTFENYRYLTVTTREPENCNPGHPQYVGKRYIQDYLESGDLERDAGVEISPGRARVYLCGSPDMIGVPRQTHDPEKRYPKPTGMVELLERRGFRVDRPHEPGDVHFEKYW